MGQKSVDFSRTDKRENGTATHANQWGYRGVNWDQAKQRFVAEIWDWPQRVRLGRFLTAVEAALAYDEAARRIYGTEAHLNFPRPGEKETKASSLHEGICANGHDLAETGRVDSRGRVACKRCNADAANRSYRRRKQQTPHPDQMR